MSVSLSILYYICVACFAAEIVAFYLSRRFITKNIFGFFALVGCVLSLAFLPLVTPQIALLAGTIVAFRLVNIGRIFKNRVHGIYLSTAGVRSALVLAVSQWAVIGIGYALKTGNIASTITPQQAITAYAMFHALIVSGLFYSFIRTYSKTKPTINTSHFSDSELPTLSVLIPARNETDDLQSCLQSLLANDYPKLEIIVYDDCSQAKTSDTVKSFAQKGVRFIKGSEPSGKWLAKNLAYQKLLEESTGEIVMFCGVDTRYGPTALRALVTTMLNKNKQMMSLMPIRHYGSAQSSIIQPMRYWWELVPPRRLFNRPPVLSTCWIITRATLHQLGGFSALSRSIIPEQILARELVKKGLGYSFLRAHKDLDVQTVKSLPEQYATAVRTRYPLLKRRPENALLFALAEILIFVSPLLLIIVGFIFADWFVLFSGLIGMQLLTTIHIVIVRLSSPGQTFTALFSLPVVFVVDVATILQSMYRYEFGTVVWKDRNVCIPAMHVYPKLPKI